jgi:DNA-binding cell septation regulator SpoVG
MRYRITDTNVTIEHADCEIEAIVAAAFRVLVPRIAPKLLFLQRNDANYSQLSSLQKTDQRFRVLQSHNDLRAICKQLRIVEGDEGLTIAPSTPDKIDRAQWSALSEDIFEQARQEIQET